MRFNKTHTAVPLLLIVVCFCLGCEPTKKNSSTTSGETPNAPAQPTHTQYRPEATADQILAATVQRYRQAKTYQDRAVLYLSYMLNGQRLDEPKRWSTKYSAQGLLATEMFNTKLHGNGKILGCEIFDIETANLDNQTLTIPYANSFGRGGGPSGQQTRIPLEAVFRDPIARQFVTGFSEMPLEPKYEDVGPWLVPPPTSLLTQQVPNPWLEAAEKVGRGNDEKIGSQNCYFVRSSARGLNVNIWIDQKEMAIVQMSFPLKLLADEVIKSDKVGEIELVAKFHEATFDQPLADAEFEFAPRPSAVLVQKLVSLPEAMPSELIGQTAPKFSLQTTSGQQRSRRYFDGKTTVLVWLSGQRAIETAAKLKQVFTNLNDPDFEHGIVFSDSDAQRPGSGEPIPSAAVAQLSRDLSVPAYYDRQHTVSSRLKIKSVPAAVVLDGDARIQYVATLTGDDWGVRLAAAIKRVAAGDDVGQEMQTAYGRYLDTYHQQLAAVSAEGLAGLPPKNRSASGTSQQSPAPNSSRLKIQAKKRWAFDQLKQPGNVVGVSSGSSAKFAIFDGQQTLAVMDDSGQFLGKQKLSLDTDEPATTVRAFSAGGETWFAVFSVLGQRVHVLNKDLKEESVLPQSQQTKRKIQDVQFYPQANKPPQLLIAWDGGGVEAFDLGDGTAATASKVDCESIAAMSGTLAGVSQGKAKTIAGDRYASQDEIQFVRLAASESQLVGLGQNSHGKWSAIGLDEQLKRVWAIQTGPQLHENYVSPIATATLPSGLPLWAIADSKRMVHLVSGSGQWLGEFEAEGKVSGLCLQAIGNKMVMVVSSPSGVECWDLGL